MGEGQTDGLRWTVHGERTIYDNPWVRLALVDVEPPNGKRFEHHVVHLGRVAVALVVDDDERALTLWRYRFATDSWGYELLGGLVDGGEEPVETARLNGGVPSTTVAAWAGHSVEILHKIYAKCLDGEDAAVRQRVQTALGHGSAGQNLGTHLAQTPGDDRKEPDTAA
jgi:hypothetical protein